MKRITYDIAFVKNDKILSYLKWFKNVGFIPMSKKEYELLEEMK